MDIIELLLDENDELTGIEAVSIVENPAIESDFIALSKQEVKFAKVDEDKKILMGAALIPNKPIFRKRNDTMFYVYFSKDTVKRASELFFMNGNQSNATLEHNMEIKSFILDFFLYVIKTSQSVCGANEFEILEFISHSDIKDQYLLNYMVSFVDKHL